MLTEFDIMSQSYFYYFDSFLVTGPGTLESGAKTL